MSQRHSVAVVVLIVILLATVFVLDGSSSPTGLAMTSNIGAIKPLGRTVGDELFSFFEIEDLDFSRVSSGKACARLASDIIRDLLMLNPDGWEGFDSSGDVRFATHAFTGQLRSGSIMFVKGFFNGSTDSSAGKIIVSQTKRARELYSNIFSTTTVNMSIKGTVDESSFVVHDGNFDSGSFSCAFEKE